MEMHLIETWTLTQTKRDSICENKSELNGKLHEMYESMKKWIFVKFQ